ncbi:hypothetical protein [uncultured Cohaesibacter sp.]|uniref:hypothetical protein n=1 Tax=uncultured Cohaesibacter sp. TaxID=1002546 RepID=UPI0029C843B2|nr:hypothetical protein [uncultured Cohaesibacter sp.]
MTVRIAFWCIYIVLALELLLATIGVPRLFMLLTLLLPFSLLLIWLISKIVELEAQSERRMQMNASGNQPSYNDTHKH